MITSQCTIMGDEELPMTMQVGMLGTDGVLLAGDTRICRKPLDGVQAPWQFYDGPKLMISQSGRIAVSCAQNMNAAKDVAQAIFREMSYGDHPECEEQVKKTALSAARGRNVECLIAFCDPLPCFYSLQYTKREGADENIDCQRITTCVAAGDTRNPAVFWGMKYYRLLPLDQLKHLAACMVVSAAALNTAAINGLEMVYCTRQGCQRVPDDSTRILESMAKTKIVQVGDFVLNGRGGL
jgi:20S proteasome alpha/beta subunit